MIIATPEQREALRGQYPQGQRVEAVRFKFDPTSPVDDNKTVPPGTQGTVRDVDDAGTVHIDWDNGCKIGAIVREGDVIRKVTEPAASDANHRP